MITLGNDNDRLVLFRIEFIGPFCMEIVLDNRINPEISYQSNADWLLTVAMESFHFQAPQGET